MCIRDRETADHGEEEYEETAVADELSNDADYDYFDEENESDEDTDFDDDDD